MYVPVLPADYRRAVNSLLSLVKSSQQAVFGFPGGPVPMVALAGSTDVRIVEAWTSARRALTGMSIDEVLAQMTQDPASSRMSVSELARSLPAIATRQRRAVAYRVEGVVMWALPGSEPASVERAYMRLRGYRPDVREALTVRLPDPAFYSVTPNSREHAALAARVLYFARWELGAAVAETQYGRHTVRLGPGVSLGELTTQIQRLSSRAGRR